MSCHNQTGPVHRGCEINYNFTVYDFIPIFGVIFYLFFGTLFAAMHEPVNRKQTIKLVLGWPYLLLIY